MQHLDEGTIHSWLDGALAPDEAARVEAHVGECAQCAGAVAEARGFIAASSRILTALDNAPRGVIPVAAPRKRVDPMVWRIAATLLVVAGGTLVVVRNRGADEQLMSARKESISFASESAGAANQAVSVQRAPAEARPTARAPELLKAPIVRPQTPPPSPAQTFAPSQLPAVVAMDAAAESQALKVVGSPRRIGAKVTLYEVAPGDTVTLTESVPVELGSIVLRGTSSTRVPTAQNVREKSTAAPSTARADQSAKSASESRATVGAMAAAPTGAPTAPPTGNENGVHVITWTDSTGTRLSLTGRMPEARLQEIRIRIERERAAAAAAAKKNP